jgi:hypothetical protein
MSIKKYLPVIKKGDSVFDKLWANMINPEKNPLSPTYEEIKERWKTVFTLRLNHFSKAQIRTQLMETYGISDSQAHKDVANAEHFYGNALRADIEGSRVIYTEWAEGFFRRALKLGDLKMQAKALDILTKMVGRDEEIQFNPEKFETSESVLVMSPEVENILLKQLQKGTIDFNSFDPEDAEFVEV